LIERKNSDKKEKRSLKKIIATTNKKAFQELEGCSIYFRPKLKP
jgi:hypothetical protein